MNYDGPSFYKKQESKIESKDQKNGNQDKKTPLEDFEKDQTRKNIVNEDRTNANDTTVRSSNHFFRSKHIPKSLQTLDGWQKAKRNEDIILELEERLKKEKDDYLFFAEYFDEDEGKVVKKPDSKEVIRKKKVALVQKEIKSDFKKPGTGLHRTLSKIIDEDEKLSKNGKNRLDSLFSDK